MRPVQFMFLCLVIAGDVANVGAQTVIRKRFFKTAKANQAVQKFHEQVEKLKRQYNEAIARDRKTYEAETKELKKTLLDQMEAAQKEATMQGNLDEAIKIREAKKEYEKISVAPSQRAFGSSKDDPTLAQIKKLEAQIKQLKKKLAAKDSRTMKKKIAIPPVAIAIGGHHYLVVETPMTQHLAQKACEKTGGHLARIESGKEQLFLTRLVKTGKHFSYWIDGSDEEVEDQWFFSNGAKLSPMTWRSGQPSNGESSQHHLVIERNTGKVNDIQSGKRNGFICEWDK